MLNVMFLWILCFMNIFCFVLFEIISSKIISHCQRATAASCAAVVQCRGEVIKCGAGAVTVLTNLDIIFLSWLNSKYFSKSHAGVPALARLNSANKVFSVFALANIYFADKYFSEFALLIEYFLILKYFSYGWINILSCWFNSKMFNVWCSDYSYVLKCSVSAPGS